MKNLSNGKIGRNEKCYCGSGKKYKKCCMRKSMPELTLIGFYFKSKDDDGFGMFVNKYWNPELFKLIEGGYRLIQEEWERQKREMMSGKFYGSYDKLMQQTIDFEMNSLKQEIPNWYKLNGFSDGLQPIKLSYVEWDVSPRTQSTLFKIIRSIYILTEVGVIKNDNYNGLNLMYTEQLKRAS
jgi:hypothetical protein